MSIPPQNGHALMKMPFYSPISMSDIPSKVLQLQMNSSVLLITQLEGIKCRNQNYQYLRMINMIKITFYCEIHHKH
ncbi:hypothetical protein PAAL66ix_08606 [Paenibacillus alvei A6-6i-x]|nr:hypothetical protein PAAL66ix_08606 [Paenibacillus alvei A6-6i-x]